MNWFALFASLDAFAIGTTVTIFAQRAMAPSWATQRVYPDALFPAVALFTSLAVGSWFA